jgi:hypothetical protein
MKPAMHSNLKPATPFRFEGGHVAGHSGGSRRLAAVFQGRSIDALLRICDRLTFTAGLSTGIVSYNRDGLVRRRMRFGRR